MSEHYKFQLKPLSYAYNALEPYIDTETVTIHHNKHLKTYVDNLNSTLKDYPQYHSWSLETLIANCRYLPYKIQTPIRNNAGGVYNHNFYFDIMGNMNECEPLENVASAIKRAFNSFDKFKQEFKQSALNQFGSGWAWLVCDNLGRLKIISTPNQDTPLTLNLFPILLIDVWEHAYYLKYQNLRTNYIDNWFNLINWFNVECRYNNLFKSF